MLKVASFALTVPREILIEGRLNLR